MQILALIIILAKFIIIIVYNFILFLSEELIKEIKNDIAIAEQKLEEPIVNKLKNDDFLITNTAND